MTLSSFLRAGTAAVALVATPALAAAASAGEHASDSHQPKAAVAASPARHAAESRTPDQRTCTCRMHDAHAKAASSDARDSALQRAADDEFAQRVWTAP